MSDYLISMPVDQMRRRILRNVRVVYPNFDDMPHDGQAECVADYLDTGLARWLRRGIAEKRHAEAYEQGLDAL